MTYSLQLYTLRAAMGEDLPGTIRRVAELGYTAVEPYNFVATAEELAEALAANGLTAPSGHAPLLRADQDEIFDAARRLGIGTVIDPHVERFHWTTAADIQTTAEALNAAAKKGAEYGITVGYHNHEFELEERIDGVSGLEVLAGHLDPEVVLEVDTYWAAVGARTPSSCSGASAAACASSTSRTARSPRTTRSRSPSARAACASGTCSTPSPTSRRPSWNSTTSTATSSPPSPTAWST